MAWTYDNTRLNSTTAGKYTTSTIGDRYFIRFLLQDTNSDKQLLQDEEIDWMQTQEHNAYMAAAACCDILIARAGLIKSKKISEFSITYDARFYESLKVRLIARGSAHQTAYAGGISLADKLAVMSDTDWVRPAFSRGMENETGTLQPGERPSSPLTQI